MRRAVGIGLAAVVLAAATALLALPAPRGEGYTPAFSILLLLLLVGVPSAVWLAVSAQPRTAPGRLPRVFWTGVTLIALAFCGSAYSMLWAPRLPSPIRLSTPPSMPATTIPRSLRFGPLPSRAAAAFRTAFPSLVVGRSLASSTGQYEVWLRRPGSQGYALQATWQAGTIHLENLQYNSDYTPQHAGPSLEALQARVQAPKGAYYGPVRFPGYLIYVSLAYDQVWVVTRSNAGVSVDNQGAW